MSWLTKLKEAGDKEHAGPEFIFFARRLWPEIVAVIEAADKDGAPQQELLDALAALKAKVEAT